jgi:hypothetical protein
MSYYESEPDNLFHDALFRAVIDVYHGAGGSSRYEVKEPAPPMDARPAKPAIVLPPHVNWQYSAHHRTWRIYASVMVCGQRHYVGCLLATQANADELGRRAVLARALARQGAEIDTIREAVAR